ncbi:hypothetical protein OG218_12490 [Kineococcus sp. NBC_00420]|uniref:hypothetical protein n=1 Tax=Kineococcus sp. NBC_00420 TaxID=2903564 RepID=UPI002E209470
MAGVLIELGVRFIAWYVGLLVRCWRGVSRWMTPRWRIDPHVERLQAWRSWLGYASVVVAVGLSGEETTGLADKMLTGAIVGFLLKAAVAVVVVLVSLAVVSLCSHRTQRRGRLRPVVRPLSLLVTVIAVPLLVLQLKEWAERRPAGSVAVEHLAPVLVSGGVVLYFTWPFLVVAAAAVVVRGVRHLFCAGDVHPLLPSVLAFAVALASGAENVHQALQPAVGVERTLSLLALGGALTVLGLTAYEHHRLRRYRLRRLGWRWSDLRVPLHELPAAHPVHRLAQRST